MPGYLNIYEEKYALDNLNTAVTYYAALLDGTFTGQTFTASGSTFTASGHGYVNGTRVQVSTTGSLPTGLNGATTYRVINKTTNTFQLSLEANYDPSTKTGTAISTSGGSGTHTVTEQPCNNLDDMDVLIRHEVNYNGSGRQSFTVGSATLTDPSRATGTDVNFTPSSNVTYRYFIIIRSGSSTTGSTTGNCVWIEDYLSTQTISTAGQRFTANPTLTQG